MKVKSEAEWQLFCSETAADPDPRADPLHDFVVAWAEKAEDLLLATEGGPEYIAEMHDRSVDAAEALRHTLRQTEEEIGRWTAGYLGMMLVILTTHWAPAGAPEDFFASLTTIEQNLFTDVAQLKLDEMARQAAATPDGGGDE